MKLVIEDIPEEGLSLDTKDKGSDFAGLEKVAFLEPVAAHFEIQKTSEDVIRVEGSVLAKVTLQCSRCLVEFEDSLSPQFSLLMLRGGEEGGEKELSRDDLSIKHFTGTELETTVIVSEELALALPTKVVCKSDCRGLCPSCGADLNTDKCDCVVEPKVDIRLEKLKDFKPRS